MVVADEGMTMTDDAANRSDTAEPTTYLLIDGENIDATLGTSIFGRQPRPEERPRWDRVLNFAETTWDHPVKSLFFINASSGTMPMSFIQALVAMGLKPIPLSGASDQKVVDIGIQRTLDAIADGHGDVMLATHDGDFLPHVERLVDDGRRVGLLAFPEMANAGYSALGGRFEIFDLESGVGCFNQVLPRLRIIDVDEFDPAAYL
jgi:uncharacterized protein